MVRVGGAARSRTVAAETGRPSVHGIAAAAKGSASRRSRARARPRPIAVGNDDAAPTVILGDGGSGAENRRGAADRTLDDQVGAAPVAVVRAAAEPTHVRRGGTGRTVGAVLAVLRVSDPFRFWGFVLAPLGGSVVFYLIEFPVHEI